MSFRGLEIFCAVLLISNIILLSCHCEEISVITPISSRLSSSPTAKASATNGFRVTIPSKETLTKRNVKLSDLSSSSSAAAKSYDPPSEFYRGPGSTSASSSSASSSSSSSSATPYNHRDSATAGFISKPITFPDTYGRNKYGGTDNSNYLGGSNSFNSWQQLKEGSTAGLGTNGIQDRISVKNYGSPDHNSLSVGYPSSSGAAGGSYAYDGRPYTGAQYVDYPQPSGHYGSAAHGGGYYGGGGSSADGGIPFDVYSGSKGHYAGHGGEYSYTYPDTYHEQPAAHKGHPDLSQKALLAKSFLIPLASAAVLGIAAALVSNPLLLQLGTVSGGLGPTVVGKRKRRDLSLSTTAAITDSEELTGATKTHQQQPEAATLAYRSHSQRR